MTCPKCGANMQAAPRFCTVCGQKFDPSTPVHTPPPVRITPPRHQLHSLVGTTLSGRFKVDSLIGEGGFGVVYKGTQLASGRAVALKVLHPNVADDANVAARFEREGRVLCQLRDPHTITTFDFEKSPDGVWFIAMELLEGKCLYDVASAQKPMQWQRVAKIIRQMCSALGEAHALGIVHRDLKPENVYLERRGDDPEFVKVLDFGIAKLVRGDGTHDPKTPQLTASGQTLGTLEYMSPEQLMGGALDGRSDLYALGVLTYEMLVCELPFPDATSPAALITAQFKRSPQRPSLAAPGRGIPSELDEIVLTCLQKDADKRYPSANALATALAGVLAMANSSRQAAAAQTVVSRSTRSDDVGATTVAVESTPVAAVERSPGPVATTPKKRSSRVRHIRLNLWVVVIVGALLGAAVMVALSW